MTGEGFFWRTTLTGSETLRYFLMVLRQGGSALVDERVNF
jgi:hypothetical protein